MSQYLSSEKLCEVPVLLITWRRVYAFKQQIEILSKVKPKYLYIFNDGPRNKQEELQILAFRDELKSLINWKCELDLYFSDKNLGVCNGPKVAIDWFFCNVEEGIILEDDVLPHTFFFEFCEQLLDKYRFDERIGQISSVTNNINISTYGGTYGFSRFPHIWGWATWRHEWENYLNEFEYWPLVKKNLIAQEHRNFSKYWINCFEAVINNQVVAWDYRWAYSQLMKGKLAVVPETSLSISIGRDEFASTSKGGYSVPVKKIDAIIKHPAFFYYDDTVAAPYPYNTLNELTSKRTIIGRLRAKIESMLY